MFLICAFTIVIGFIIYRVIKIEDWFEKYRCVTIMSRLSLKKLHNPDRQPPCENVPQVDLNDTIEISDDDESDTLQTREIISSDADSIVSSGNLNVSQEEFMRLFQKSTDSLEFDEKMEDPTSSSASIAKGKPSLFNWHSPNTNEKRHSAEMQVDSDSSNDARFESGLFHRKQKKKAKMSPEAAKSIKCETTEDALPEVTIQHEQLISGIRVKLPVKPYSCQVAVMNKLIQGCVKKENCLLESPTGSGKTLALLCGVLAWHDHYCAEVEEHNAQQGGGDYEASNFPEEVGGKFPNEFGDGCNAEYCCAEVDDLHSGLNDIASANQGAELKCLKIPKIYYGTRTHKQIEQVVRELKKTCYRHKKMTILSSREQTCIQQSTTNKTELCNDLLDPVKHKGCPYYNELNKKTLSTFHAAKRHGLGPVWDIEDLVTIGKEKGACPYFAARSLMDHADIIFCPYNYIIDPDIRGSMQLDLQNQVIILDEAHNIEDNCRNVASANFREDDLRAVAMECQSLAKNRKDDFTTYNNLKLYLLQLANYLKTITLDQVDYNSDNRSSRYWTGAELSELFNMNNLGDSAYNSFYAAYNAAMTDLMDAKEAMRLTQISVKPVISDTTKRIMEKLVFAMRMITSKEFTNDYRACVTETTVNDYKSVTVDTWLSVKKQETQRVRTLKLLCMNPGLAFSRLAESARCIILASGTLTPTISFQSELNTKFTHVLNTAHVIPKDQVYATCVPRGPNGTALRAVYQNVNSWSFQDELGKVLLDICETVPHGILCFFSSYTVMNTQMGRWRQNSTWSKITATKQIFIEPRKGTDLTAIMDDYREVIRDTTDGPNGGISGALFLAVFRGKVAEGIDFKDNEARCVVTVGIPFAVLKDPEIQMKREYNDLNITRGLLNGKDWYSIQAFRALNQALGRCLRHINDWGAVLLVDDRFLQQGNKENLPKWVKTMWVNRSEYTLKDDLPNFVRRQKARESKN